MKYSLASLGDVLEKIIGGGTPSKENKDYWNGSIPWCSVKDMKEGSYRIKKTEDFITEIGLKNSASNLIPKNTVITSTRMGLGRAFLSSVDMAINQDLKALIPNSKIDKIFLLWSIIFQKDIIEGLGTGATVKGIRLETLKSIKIPLPPLQTQKKIAGILSAYDDAIENNLRRIKLLEEMAQITYEEWFVRLRFPGHESTPINEATGLPEGWRKQFLGDFVSTQYGYTESAVDDLELPKFVRITDFNKATYIYWPDVPNCPIDEKAFEKYKLEIGDVIVARMADPGKVAIIEKDIKAVFASYCIRLRPKNKKELTPYYFFYTLRGDDYQGFVFGASTGATRRSANAKTLTHYDILVPKHNVMNAFEEMVLSIRSSINLYLDQNQRLREARDILLPRLMTGVIDAEKYQPENFLKKN